MAKQYPTNTLKHEIRAKYPVDVYINYARSIFLDVERQVLENPPARPAEFWRKVEDATNRAKQRLRKVAAVINED